MLKRQTTNAAKSIDEITSTFPVSVSIIGWDILDHFPLTVDFNYATANANNKSGNRPLKRLSDLINLHSFLLDLKIV